jgi:hypothetical protein
MCSGPDGPVLQLGVKPRKRAGKVLVARGALAELVAKRLAIQTIQIGKPRFASRLRSHVRAHDGPRLGVQLSVAGVDVTYPARVVFGPDEVVLNLG